MSKGLVELELHDELDEPKLNGQSEKKRPSPRQRLSAFSKVSVVILFVLTALMIFLGIGIRQPLVLIIAGIEVLIIALIMAGIRWAPVLSTVLGSLTLIIFTSATGYPLHHLTHPKDAFGYGVQVAFSFVIFTLMLTVFWSAIMLILTGIAAVIHNYSQRVRRTPSWFNTALGVALGVLMGAFILGSLAQPTPTVASGSTGTPTVHLGAGNFSQSSITLSKGSTLTLVDDGTYHHNISNGTWKAGQPMLEVQTGEPVVKNHDLNAAGASFVVGPFNTAGTYHLLCSIHSGMTLTIIVQ